MSSIHEADMSDLDSCCSAVSDNEPRMTRLRGRSRQPRTESQEDEEVSEVESFSSAVSASRAGQSSRRSTRRKAIPARSAPAHHEAGDVKVDPVLETEPCSSVVSKSQRVTRSQRKTAHTRSSTKQQTEGSELSDAESCASSVSGATRSRRQTCPIPMHLDEASEGSCSPAPTGRRSRAARGKTAAAVTVSESQSCDSEGFESGPSYSMTTRRWRKTQSTGPKVLDSDSELTDVQSPLGSPCSSSDRGTPCSSRTGSGNSSRGTRASRHSIKDLSVVLEKAVEPAEEDSKLESTLIAKDADCTLLEENKSQMLEDVSSTEAGMTEDVERGVRWITEDVSPSISDPGCAKEAEVVCEAAVAARDQQEELPAENKDGNISEVEMMQETVPSPEPLKPSVTVTICERDSENTEETKEEEEEVMEVADVSQGVEHVDEDAVVETQSSKEEKMEVSTLDTDAQQVVDSSEAQTESIQVTSKQEHKITVESDSEQQPKDVIVQNTKIISLLASSDDEDDYAEEQERVVSGEEEEEEDLAEERGRPSKKSEVAAESVEGLFMIDTRPGQAADEDYYKDRLREEEEAGRMKEGVEQEEQDEEFVDEEEEDDDDDDAEILFSSRDPQS